VRSALVHVMALAQYAAVYTRNPLTGDRTAILAAAAPIVPDIRGIERKRLSKSLVC
jgi:hypothetical protein